MGKLIIKNLRAEVEGKEILRGLNLTISPGEIHAVMGPNGSGKSTLAQVLAGHPGYKIISGEVTFAGKNILKLKPEERAKLGIFLAFQYPLEIPGLSFKNFLRYSFNNLHSQISPLQFQKLFSQEIKSLKMKTDFERRNLNEGFSGGEKKKAEILQLQMLNPKLAILDETDSGLDIDALKQVAEAIKKWFSKKTSLLIITHYQRILRYLKPDFVHVLYGGKIVKSGGYKLSLELERSGYSSLSK